MKVPSRACDSRQSASYSGLALQRVLHETLQAQKSKILSQVSAKQQVKLKVWIDTQIRQAGDPETSDETTEAKREALT